MLSKDLNLKMNKKDWRNKKKVQSGHKSSSTEYLLSKQD